MAEQDRIAACADCDWQGPESLTHDLPEDSILERVGPGEIMPVGECPECGAVAHYLVNPEGVAQFGGRAWQMIADALDILSPDSAEADAFRQRLLAEVTPLALALDAPQPGDLKAFTVVLRADGIQVTADGEDQATRYALDDAREFIAAHSYSVEDVEASEDDPDDAEDIPAQVSVRLVGRPAAGADLWTFAGFVSVIVAAVDEAEAPTVAATRLELEGELIR